MDKETIEAILLQYARDVGGIYDHEGFALDAAIARLFEMYEISSNDFLTSRDAGPNGQRLS